MDKSWMQLARNEPAYTLGVVEFIKFALANTVYGNKFKCPCVNCANIQLVGVKDCFDHLIIDGIMKGYTRWVFHGEAGSSVVDMTSSDRQMNEEPMIQDEMHDLLEDIRPRLNHNQDNLPTGNGERPNQTSREGPDANAKKFYKLVEDAELELYPGCKLSKLSFVVQIFHIKCLNGWSNKSFTMLLELLKEAFPTGASVPESFYETKKIISDLGLHYDKIDACPNDCMLFWKEDAKETVCRICGASRWKTYALHPDDAITQPLRKDPKIPAKILRYFPITPRLQRLYMSKKTAAFMTWHDDKRTNDGIFRHPADSPAWQDLDSRYPNFSSDPRNVRLGLASDGFNPFRTMSIAHSTWPVVLIPYNLPPWLCMKQPYMMLSLLIPGPSGPGNDLDVYFQSLVEELKELWDIGFQTFDASRNETFQMHAAVLWTISDFPAYANLSGWTTKGELACPCCCKDTCSKWLDYGRKQSYMGHRRFLPAKHKFRFDKMSFDGTEERRPAPRSLTGRQALEQLENVNVILGKKKDTKGKKANTSGKEANINGKEEVTGGKKRKRWKKPNESAEMCISAEKTKEKPRKEHNWKKKSIFFTLPYWESLLLRHNLDVMHIEKNVCDNVIGTLLNIEGKSKDGVKARLDLRKMKLRRTLHPITKTNNKTYLPSACFTMSPKEKDIFCSILKYVKVPDGYSSNISRRVNLKQRKISGLKSHDCHVLMQQLLPLAIRRTLPKKVSSVLIELCSFFRELCSKVLKAGDLIKLKKRIALTLCHMEKIFTPAFFDIMVHLPIHLADEARLGGPVQYRWMYPIERYLLTLKSYVRNRNYVEGSIAEDYLAEECLNFCSRYLEGVESKMNRDKRNDEDVRTEIEEGFSNFSISGRPIGKVSTLTLEERAIEQAHRYVLFNCEAVGPFLNTHITEVRRNNPRARPMDIERNHKNGFSDWFKAHVETLHESRSEQISEKLRWLSGRPNCIVRSYKGYVINGIRFHTKDREQQRKTQNSGVVVTARTSSFANARDMNPDVNDITYHGVLKDVIELDYFGQLKAVLFKCDRFDATPGRGVKIDEFGFRVVNMARRSYEDEPFIFAAQVEQVFYVQEHLNNKDWHVIVKTKPRDVFDVIGDLPEACIQCEVVEEQNVEDVQSWERTDIIGTEIDESLEQLIQSNQEDQVNDTELDDNSEDENTFEDDDDGGDNVT
ncbi:uncharacterized protein LOC143878834 [Tasmannia lanceolata]|uniref:uncharacterized protein LOC143878834 n=1 Tax=Tasmannia lanceolata TaxID=3420 RepID=UPI004062BFF2